MMIRTAAMVALLTLASPAIANDRPRDLLTQASFQDADAGAALKRIDLARALAADDLRKAPNDYEAALMQATAIGYRSKLTGSRAEAIDARKRFEALVQRDPGNPDAQLALGAWHLGAVHRLGGFVGRAALGAQRSVGYTALDRAIVAGKGRPLFTGLTGLLRLQDDAGDARGRQLVELAARGNGTTALDAILKRAAQQMLPIMRAANEKAVKIAAARLLPLGRMD